MPAGRPRKPESEKMVQRIYVPATLQELAEFDKRAKECGVSRQKYARAIVADRLGWK